MADFRYSVVVPYHDDGDTIRRALDSLVEQLPPPTRVLICDDASPPAGAATLRSVVVDHALASRISVLTHEANQGPSAARNTAWAEVTTPWLCFLDADDAWHPHKMAVQRRLLEGRPDITLLGTRVSILDETPPPTTPLPAEARAVEVGIRQQLLRNRFATSSVVVRSDRPERFDACRRYAEDYDLWCRLLVTGEHGAVIDASLTFAFKPPFGHSGASAHLIRMQKGALRVLRGLREGGHITTGEYAIFRVLSVVRFARRLLITLGRRAAGTSQRLRRTPHPQP